MAGVGSDPLASGSVGLQQPVPGSRGAQKRRITAPLFLGGRGCGGEGQLGGEGRPWPMMDFTLV